MAKDLLAKALCEEARSKISTRSLASNPAFLERSGICGCPMGDVVKLKAIAKLAAKIYAGEAWYRLSDQEEKLVKMLEEARFLTKAKDGFVGKVAR